MDIDWEELQAAFLSARDEEDSYLDTETGEVFSLSSSEEEDEEIDEEQDGEEDGEGREQTLREEMEDDPDRFLLITPLAEGDLAEWMEAFLVTVKQKELAAALAQASRARVMAREYERILRADPAEKARWLAYLESKVQEAIEAWLEENDVESDGPPPWKVASGRRQRKAAEAE